MNKNSIFISFEEFVGWSKYNATKMHTLIEFRNYPEHGFGTVSFMTDHFGGTYCTFKYEYSVKNIYEGEDLMESEKMILERIKEKKKEMEHNRDLDYIYDSINKEY